MQRRINHIRMWVMIMIVLLCVSSNPDASRASPLAELPSSNCWRSAACVENGECWFATWDGVAVNSLIEGWQAFTPSNSSIGQNYCHDVRKDSSGYVWIAHHDNGVSLLDYNSTLANKADDSWIYFTTTDGLLADRVHAVEFAPDGKVWFGTDAGISILDLGGTPFNKGDDFWSGFSSGTGGLADGPVNSILFDSAGCIWAGTDYGLSRDCGGGWSELSWSGVAGCFECCWTWPSFVWEVIEDQSGNVWIADGLCGASVWDGADWTVYDVEDPDGLPAGGGTPMNPGAMSLAVDGHNNVWIGMGASGVVRMDGFNQMTEYTSSDPWLGFNDQIEGADFDSQGDGWFASCGTPGSYSTYTLPGSSDTIVTPGDGGTLYSPDRRAKVSIPAGAVGTNTQVTITPANTPPVGPRRPLYIMDLTAVEEGTSNPVTTFTTPYDLEVVYTELQRGVVPEASLGIYAWDGLSWIVEPTSAVDASSNLVSAQPDHMSYFGALGESLDLWLPLIVR